MNVCKQLYCERPAIVVEYKTPSGVKVQQLKHCLEHKQGKNYKIGSKKILNTGYMLVKTVSGWIPEHRIVMEEKIGRKLSTGESVHHINGIKHDNRPENLELWVGNITKGQRATDIKCPNCHVSYWEAHQIKTDPQS